MNLTKILMVVIPVGAVATFVVPALLDKQRREDLTEQFQPALKTYDKVGISRASYRRSQVAFSS